jgi:glutathione S-transferase
MTVKLYNVAYSGNSYKVRLLLAQLGIPYETIEVDILKGESRTADFLKINPNGRTPVLDDDGFVSRRIQRDSRLSCKRNQIPARRPKKVRPS